MGRETADCPAQSHAASCPPRVSSSEQKADANDPANFQAPCVAALEQQVKVEFQASLQYLRMRGAENNDFFGDTPIKPKEGRFYWSSVDDALRLALKMEKDVSARMKEMIDVCSSAGSEDYHAADWLTGTWLEEQMEGQRMLAGLINTFNNFKRGHEELAEWMFDQELGGL